MFFYRADAEFVAASRQDIPALVEALEELGAEAERRADYPGKSEKGWLESVPEPWASKLKVEIISGARKAQSLLENAVGEEGYRQAREEVWRMGFDPDGLGLDQPLGEDVEDEDPSTEARSDPADEDATNAPANHGQHPREDPGSTGGETARRGRRQFEVDLRELDDKILDDDYARELYAALCGNKWVNKEDPQQRYSCTDRYAGEIVTFLRAMGESYLDFYLDFGRPASEEGVVSERIESDLGDLGWVRQT